MYNAVLAANLTQWNKAGMYIQRYAGFSYRNNLRGK